MLISVMLATMLAASVASNTVASNTGADPALANRHAMWISLTDKPLPKGGVRAEHTPLTARALARRAARDSVHGIEAGLKSAPTAPLVDARDLPIASARLDAVLATGAKFRAQSRWLNAISVDATDAQINLPIVVLGLSSGTVGVACLGTSIFDRRKNGCCESPRIGVRSAIAG